MRLNKISGDNLVPSPPSLPPLNRGEPEHIAQDLSFWVLSISKGGDFTASLGNPFQLIVALIKTGVTIAVQTSFWSNPYLDDWIIFTGMFLLLLQGVFHIVKKTLWVSLFCFVCLFFFIILPPFPLLEFLTEFQTK